MIVLSMNKTYNHVINVDKKMNRRNEMGGLRVERTQYRRWGGD